jgi:branched-subunit amino acid permease
MRSLKYVKQLKSFGFLKLKPLKQLNNVSESLNRAIPNMDKPFTLLALAYVIWDTKESYDTIKDKNKSLAFRSLFILDNLTWHSLASFVFPSIIVSNTIHASMYIMEKLKVRINIARYSSVVIAFIVIFYSVNPIDKFGDVFMDYTYRQLIDYRKYDNEEVQS